MIISAHIVPVPCKISTHPQKPKYLAAKAISDSQVLLVWTSQLGPGYRFRINVNVSDVPIKQIVGPLGFGDIAAVVVNGLLPSTTYKFAVEHECEENLKTYSYAAKQPVATLAPGKGL